MHLSVSTKGCTYNGEEYGVGETFTAQDQYNDWWVVFQVYLWGTLKLLLLAGANFSVLVIIVFGEF